MEKERKFNSSEWIFERSSGFSGYRNTITADWIYENEYNKFLTIEENEEINKKLNNNFIISFLKKHSKAKTTKEYQKEVELCEEFFKHIFNEEKCKEILYSLDEFALSIDRYSFGLPNHQYLNEEIEVIKNNYK